MTICATCGNPIVKVGETRSGLALWGHDGEPADHKATPQPTCPACRSPEYRVRAEAWGDSWDCNACGHHEFVSLGD